MSLRYTPIRFKWLETLESRPGAKRPHYGQGFQCMRAGLTRWHKVNGVISGEELTDAGRAALEEWKTLHQSDYEI